MRGNQFRLWTLLLGLLWMAAGYASGQTIIIDRPPPMPPMPPVPDPHRRPPRPPMRHMQLQIKNLGVNVAIVDGVAETKIDQIFHNRFDRTVEGTFIYPLDDDVAVSRFTMNINGKEVEGKLLGVEEARRIYESIVARMRDPALLEYVGKRMFQARIFPINPKADVRVRLSYTQMLKSDAGLVGYRYPLNIGKHVFEPIEQISLLARIKSKVAIKSVFCPSHKLAVSRVCDHEVTASYEGAHEYPNRDLKLFYSLSDKEFGLTMLAYRESGNDGYFLARISPPASVLAEDVVAKDISFVIDTSGSMSGGKIEQARRALKFCLSNLNKQDRFNVIPFSHEPLRFADELMPATPENIERARKFANDLKAIGGTNINDALLAVLSDAPKDDETRPYYIVFLTDGQPTISVTDPDEILENVADKNAARVRLFVFGVGHDVNTKLLDLLAEQNRGWRDYVEPGQDLELVLSSFYRKVADPVLGDLSLSFGDLRVHDMYPPKLSDLFSGTELVVTGRYSGLGHKAVKLSGTRRGKEEWHVYETTFPTDDRTHDFLPRLWATRKVGYLLDEIRLHGESKELKQTIVQLATQYGIITPYTAYLVTESDRLAHGERRGVWSSPQARQTVNALEGLGYLDYSEEKQVEATGGRAVARSKVADTLQRAERSIPYNYGGKATDGGDDESRRRVGKDRKARLIEHVGTRTFYYVDGKWIDGTYDGKKETKKIVAFSPEYFGLVSKHKDLAACLALGQRVIVVIDGVAYETTPPPEPREEPSQDKD